MKKLFFIVFLLLFFTFSFAQDSLIQRKANSFLQIPITRFDYNELSKNQSDSIHNGLKPLHYFELNPTTILSTHHQLKLNKKSWLGRKLFNENFFVINGQDYFITIDPVVDLRLGKDNITSDKIIFQNTRGIKVEGSIGKQVSFSSTVAENYGRFPKFSDRYAWINYPHIVPGFGLNKSEDKNFVDYPYADGYVAYRPSKYFFFELGHKNHFIGQGVRSLFLSDNAGVYPYFMVSANFWKVKYTTFWTAYQDLRPEAYNNGAYRKKYSAVHYIDWHALPKLHIGFFETVVWYNENRRGFDVNFLNPLIFFKTVEYQSGSNASNTILGLSADYKLPYNLQIYSQFVLDEMTIKKFFGDSGYWANKFGYQAGIKYYDAFTVPNLFLRVEYNTVRPYTFSHNNPTTIYGHNFQALAHPWGANFKEIIFELQYRKNRLYTHNTFIMGKKGFDYPNDDYAYGGNIFNYIRPENKTDKMQTLQGNLANMIFNQFEVGYILNPATNLKVFSGFVYRKTGIDTETSLIKNETSQFFYFGLKTHLWNDKFDLF
jgi:hypothetical protein